MGCGASAPAHPQPKKALAESKAVQGSTRSEVNPYKSMVVGRQRPLHDSMTDPDMLSGRFGPPAASARNLLGSTVFHVTEEIAALASKSREFLGDDAPESHPEPEEEEGQRQPGLQQQQQEQQREAELQHASTSSQHVLRHVRASEVELQQ